MTKGIKGSQLACYVADCGNRAIAVGLCGRHYQRLQKGTPLDAPRRAWQPHDGPCTVEGCEREQYGHGYCTMHWQRWRQHGDPLITKRFVFNGPLEERFWLLVDKDGPVSEFRPDLGQCYLWIGYIDPESGYGTCQHKRAHVVGYELQNGPIPPGLHVDHLCRVRHCVRGAHLEAKSLLENVMALGSLSLAAVNVAKTHCPQGHEYNAANTHVRKNGHRQCRVCDRIAQSLKRQRERESGVCDDGPARDG